MPTIPLRGPDADSRAWVAGLSSVGPAREAACERLHALMLKAARFEVGRRSRALGGLPGENLDDLALRAAADATMSVLRKLDTYRGESRFTTWAYKFALLEAGVSVRRRAWQDREVTLADDRWVGFADRSAPPADDLETSELLAAIGDAIATVLSPNQRAVLVALTIDGVPIDVLAERRATTRGALYKTLHDARKKLRLHLAASGLGPDAPNGGAR